MNPSGRGFFYCFHYTECSVYDVISEIKDPVDSTKTIINKSIVGSGTAYCSTSDQHNPFSGKKMALSIAMKNCRFSRDIRKEIWDRLLADEKARIEAKKANKEKRENQTESTEDTTVPTGHS